MLLNESVCILLLIGVVALAKSVAAADSVVIDASTRYQTIRSWGAPAGLIGNPDALLDPLFDELVHTLGLTRLRFEPPRREWEDAINDDADPLHATAAAFRTTATDDRVAKVYLPFKQRVESNGDRFEMYVSPSFFDGGSSGTAPAWLLNSPGEYTEWATTFLQYLRTRHKLNADFYSVCNEAGNNNAFSAAVVASMIKALAPRLEALGFRTRIQFPECVSADRSWNYIQSTQADAEMWRPVGLVSYHLYGGNNSRPQIRDFAWARNLPTGQTEYMGLNLNRLYDDLTLGGVSTWEYYALKDILPLNSSRTWFSRTQTFWQTRQVLRFVREGAVRVAASTSTTALRALAFTHNGQTTLVLLNTTDSAARTADVSGLTPGVYGRSQTVGSGAAQELGLIAVTSAGPVSLSLPANSTLTLYPHSGANLPPALTDWKANPTFLKQPASTVTLSASATDCEEDSLAFAWSVRSAPAGASVHLTSPNSSSCTVTGMLAAGSYVFQIAVNDGVNTVNRRLPVDLFNGNQPPELLDVHNRLPVTVRLPTAFTTLRSAGRDLEGDSLTFQWSVINQPPGASALLLSPTTSACVATNLTVAGNYLFRIELRDPTHAISNDLPVTVHPLNRAPVIGSASASPASLTLPASGTTLSAATSDPDGDAISHWWSVNSAPAGALPWFASQGSNVTAITGLILPGTYTFRLTAVDQAGVANRNVSITVNAGSSPPQLFLASPNGGETYSARQTIHLRWSSYQVPGNVKLEFNDGQSGWTTIAASTPNDGIEPWTLPHGNFTGCRIRVSSTTGGAPADESDGTFSITADTPRLSGISRTNGTSVLQFDLEPGVANALQRTVSLSTTSQWETLVVLSNAEQTSSWSDVTGDLPTAFYRIVAP